MHPALRKGPLFYKKTTPPPFHFLPTGLRSTYDIDLQRAKTSLRTIVSELTNTI